MASAVVSASAAGVVDVAGGERAVSSAQVR